MGRPPLPIGSHGAINVRRTGKTWEAHARFRDADGVTRPVTARARTKSAAERRLKEKLANRTVQARSGHLTPDSRVSELAEAWFAEQERLAAAGEKAMTSVQQYMDHYRRHIKGGLADLTLREVRVSTVHQFLVKVAAKSTSTAVMCRKVLSGMFGWAVVQDLLDTNPVTGAGKISRKPQRKPRALAEEQIRDWLWQADRDEVAVQWDLGFISRGFLATGCRIGELLAISLDEPEAINLKQRYILLTHHLVYIKGQGIVRMPSTKGVDEDEIPRVDFPEWYAHALDARMRELNFRGPLHPHPATGGYRDPREVRKAIRAVRERFGYAWLTSHQLGRKTVATILDRGGATAREIANLLRHAKPSMTQDVYMDRTEDTRRQAALLDAALGDVARLRVVDDDAATA